MFASRHDIRQKVEGQDPDLNPHIDTKLSALLKLMEYKSKDSISIVTKAYNFAKKAHDGQKRYSGEPYFNHVFETASYIAKLGMGPNMVATGLLHDVVEDVDGIESEDIEREFNKDIRKMVDGVTKLGDVRYHGSKRHTESLRKLFAATSQDVRVIIVKLMDRLHNARTLESVPKHKRRRIAIETLEIYAPIADRLGMGVVKKELEDAVFEYAYPREFKKTCKIFKELGGKDERSLKKIHNSVKKKLAEYGVTDFKTSVRVKGIYSLYKKLERKNWDQNEIRDIFALRIIVPKVSDCYTIMGIIHAEWRPMPGRIKDYIAFPKPNGYKSIHTTIHTGDGGVLEVQIRTDEMHQDALYGIASHLTYKEQTTNKNAPKRSISMDWIKQFIPSGLMQYSDNTNKINEEHSYPTEMNTPKWIKHIAETRQNAKDDEYLDTIKTDFFSHRIFVFTPKGDVIDLPIEASPVDFAYSIHSEVGHHISGAKINGKMASLDKPLHNGDIVEIITSPKAKPTRKWLDYVKTSMAKRFIRTYLRDHTGAEL